MNIFEGKRPSKQENASQQCKYDKRLKQFGKFSKLDELLEVSKKLREFGKLVEKKATNKITIRKHLNKIRCRNEELLQFTHEILSDVTKHSLNEEDIELIRENIDAAEKKVFWQIIEEADRCKVEILFRKVRILGKAFQSVKGDSLLNRESKRRLSNIEAMINTLEDLCNQLQTKIESYEMVRNTTLWKEVAVEFRALYDDIESKYQQCFEEFKNLQDTTGVKLIDQYWIYGEESALIKCKVDLGFKLEDLFSIDVGLEKIGLNVANLIINVPVAIAKLYTGSKLRKLIEVSKALDYLTTRFSKLKDTIAETEKLLNLCLKDYAG